MVGVEHEPPATDENLSYFSLQNLRNPYLFIVLKILFFFFVTRQQRPGGDFALYFISAL